MEISLIFAFAGVGFLVWSYLTTRHLTPDNAGLHLLLAIGPSFLLQAIAFFALDVSKRTIDTVPISNYVDKLPLGSAVLLLTCILGGLANVFLARRPIQSATGQEFVLPKRLIFALLLFATISVIGLHIFATSVGESLTSLLAGSNKWLIASAGDTVSFDSNGYARFLTTLGTPAFLFFMGYLIYFRKKLTLLRLFIGSILLIAATLPPSLLSARGAALYVFISLFLMLLVAKRLKSWHLVIGTCIVLILFSILSIARDGFEGEIGITGALESRAFYGGGVSLFNTTVISDAYLSGSANLHYGESYIGLLTSPIPRSMWPNKPVFAYDQQIAQDIYKIFGPGAQAIPAGLPSEAIMNFGFLGGLVLTTILISLPTLIHNRIITSKRGFLSFLIRCIVFPKFAAKLLASGLGFAVMDALTVLIGVLFIYAISIRGPKKR